MRNGSTGALQAPRYCWYHSGESMAGAVCCDHTPAVVAMRMAASAGTRMLRTSRERYTYARPRNSRRNSMKSILRNCAFLASLATMLAIAVFASSGTRPQEAPARKSGDNRVTEAQLDKWMQELSNWGRWGKDDLLGAANTITPEKRRQAAALVRTGETVS